MQILEIPDIYKTSNIRYKNLRNRLSRNKVISHEDQLLASVKSNMQNQSLNMSEDANMSNDSSLYEEMDWEPMEDEKITFEVVLSDIHIFLFIGQTITIYKKHLCIGTSR